MTALAHGGVSIDLPKGWDGQIRQPDVSGAARSSSTTAAAGVEEPAALLHAGSFALPAERGDYGSGAVEIMGGSDILICLLEHEREAADTALFARQGIPTLTPTGFSPQTMQRAVAGMCGYQEFFQVGGRPFCLYVVLGSWATRAPLVRTAARVVSTLQITS
jgi:hypothetical protein